MSGRYCHIHKSLHPTVYFSICDIMCMYIRVTLYYCTIHIHATYVHMYMCMHAYKAALKQGVPRLPHCSCSAGILIAGTHVLCKCPSMLIGGAGCSWRHSFKCKGQVCIVQLLYLHKVWPSWQGEQTCSQMCQMLD